MVTVSIASDQQYAVRLIQVSDETHIPGAAQVVLEVIRHCGSPALFVVDHQHYCLVVVF